MDGDKKVYDGNGDVKVINKEDFNKKMQKIYKDKIDEQKKLDDEKKKEDKKDDGDK